MASNRGVVYLGPGKVEVQSIDFPKMRAPDGKEITHGAILKIVTTNICGSDQHMVRGRTTAAAGLVLGHEITGEVIEKGADVNVVSKAGITPWLAASGFGDRLGGVLYNKEGADLLLKHGANPTLGRPCQAQQKCR